MNRTTMVPLTLVCIANFDAFSYGKWLLDWVES